MENKTTSDSGISPELQMEGARVWAATTAGELLTDAAECVEALLKYDERMSTAPKHATLVSAHALLSLLDYEGGRIATALEKILQRLDCLDGWHARGEDVDAQPDDEVVPTAYESERMLGVLKADWLRKHPEHTQEEYRDAMRRFEILAGL